MISTVVVLPAPFGPSRATISPAPTVERHAVDDRPLAVALDQAIDARWRRRHGAIRAYWRSKSASVSSPIWIERMTPSLSTK